MQPTSIGVCHTKTVASERKSARLAFSAIRHSKTGLHNPMNAQEIIQKIQAELPDAQVYPDGEGCNFRIEVISSAFAGKSMLQQRQR